MGIVGVLLALVLAARFAPIRLGRLIVVGASMEPSLLEGDRLLVVRGMPALLRLQPGTVVLARSPAAPDLDVIKRIAGTIRERGRTAYVLLGDNPAASTDSRRFGPVPATAITGRVLCRYWPDARRGPIR